MMTIYPWPENVYLYKSICKKSYLNLCARHLWTFLAHLFFFNATPTFPAHQVESLLSIRSQQCCLLNLSALIEKVICVTFEENTGFFAA